MTEFLKLVSVAEAHARFDRHFKPSVTEERCAVIEALGRVLAQDLRAPHALPTFVRSTVDGYAVRASDTYGASQGAPAYLDVSGEAEMGAAAEMVVNPGEAVLVHTGGMVPPGANAVIMLENTAKAGAPLFSTFAAQGSFVPYSIESYRAVASGENCIQIGEEIRQGDLLLSAGHRIRPQDIGGLLAMGIVSVSAARQPRVAIISQGDEVVPPDQNPGPGQVRDINSHALAAFVTQAGGIPLNYPIVPDQKGELLAAARRGLREADVLVITAGSSVSYRDLTAQVIQELGEPGVLVHGVAIRPGKPTILAVCEGKAVFGLPGNPVSCINIFRVFVAPVIHALQGAPLPIQHTLRARVARNIPAAAGRADTVRVRIEQRDGEFWAVPIFGASNLIFTLVRSTGAVDVPLDSNGIAEGNEVTVRMDD
jgi:molybdopterin molybdotransferase